MLSVAKILENMELGHNIMHGQWDWMRDPEIHSTTWEWDSAISSDDWKKSHNDMHHMWTNVIGKDKDVGYGRLRVTTDQEWKPEHLGQVGPQRAHRALLRIRDRDVRRHDGGREDRRTRASPTASTQEGLDQGQAPNGQGLHRVPATVRHQRANDAHRQLHGEHSAQRMDAHDHLCGHFPDNVEYFTEEEIEGESQGEWYLRQLMGSANIEGSELFHIMSGNPSHQIEHHLFQICRAIGMPRSRRRFSRFVKSTGCRRTRAADYPSRATRYGGHWRCCRCRMKSGRSSRCRHSRLAVSHLPLRTLQRCQP